jgi:ATP-dependent DNA helicase RecQ
VSGSPLRERIRCIARTKFDFEQLRPGQEEAMESVVQGRDTLAIMPTGAGKSAIYQIPAIMVEGPTPGGVPADRPAEGSDRCD